LAYNGGVSRLRTPRSQGALVGVGLLLALGGAVALAQDVVLHELVPNLGANEGSSLVSGGGAEPAAIVYDGEILRAPEGGPLSANERAMEPTPGDGEAQEEEGRRSPSFHPDRVTALHGAVPYFEVFTPAITPYKRVTSLDAVRLSEDGVPYLAVGHPDRERVEIDGPGSRPPDGRARDRLWGSVVPAFRAGREVPPPAVPPGPRAPPRRPATNTPHHLERDGAGNYVAVLDSGAAAGEVRAVFLTDAPRSFFGFDDERSWPVARADALGDEVVPLPPAVARDAQSFAAELGLSRDMSFQMALSELARHFRSFEESEEPPADTGNVYLDLARGMRGVCRHRAYAFVITASALGISSRFVSNEAHAWVEVHVPDHGGWLRVDLGGSAQGLAPRSAETGPSYEPRVDDPLPRPPEYERALAQAGGASSAGGSNRPGGTGGGTGGASGTAPDEAGADGAPGEPGDPPEAEPLASIPPSRSSAPRIPLTLSLAHHSPEVLRGQSIEVTGSAASAEGRAPGLRVEVVLRDRDGAERLLGVTVPGANGNVHASFGVPPDTHLGEHGLVVRSPGDARLAAAVAE